MEFAIFRTAITSHLTGERHVAWHASRAAARKWLRDRPVTDSQPLTDTGQEDNENEGYWSPEVRMLVIPTTKRKLLKFLNDFCDSEGA
jgi:hypothetical protein